MMSIEDPTIHLIYQVWRGCNTVVSLALFLYLFRRTTREWNIYSMVSRDFAVVLITWTFLAFIASLENLVQSNPAGARVWLTTMALAFTIRGVWHTRIERHA